MQAIVPPADQVEPVQGAQSSTPPSAEYPSPGAQVTPALSGSHAAAFVLMLVPSAQTSQRRSRVDAGVPATSSPAWQTVQGSQRSALVVVEKLLSPQAVQLRLPVPDGVAETYWPGAQAPVVVQLLAPALDQVPVAQGWQAVVPSEALPATQRVQLLSVVADPAAYPWPLAQEAWLQLVHAPAFNVFEYFPEAQAVQVRLVVAFGVLETAWPAAQSLHRVQVPAPEADK